MGFDTNVAARNHHRTAVCHGVCPTPMKLIVVVEVQHKKSIKSAALQGEQAAEAQPAPTAPHPQLSAAETLPDAQAILSGVCVCYVPGEAR